MNRQKSLITIMAFFIFVNTFADNRDKEEVHKLINQSAYILNNIKGLSMEDFRSYYVDENDVNSVLNNEIIKKDTVIQKVLKETIQYRIGHIPADYVDLLKRGLEYEINWSDIKLKYATYEKEPNINIAGVVSLVFEIDDELYLIELKIIKVDSSYKFCQIESLQVGYEKEAYELEELKQMGEDVGYFYDSL